MDAGASRASRSRRRGVHRRRRSGSADLRILRAHGLRADESALTGESVPVDKAAEPVDPTTQLAERRSLLHGGTLVTAGSAEAVVVETGDRTELGRISGLLSSVEDTQTPLTRSIARLGSTITKIIGAVAVVLLGVALLRGYPIADAALAAITLAVARDPRRAAGDRHHCAGDRRAADGSTARGGAGASRRGDTGLHFGHLHGQNWHTDPQ